MGLKSIVKRLYNAFVNSAGVTYTTFPAAAAAATLTGGKSYAWGAWAQIALGALITADVWLAAIELSAAAVDDFFISVGTGVAPAGTNIAIVGLNGNDESGRFYGLKFPVLIALGTGIVARTANANAVAANTVGCRATVAWGV